MDLHGLLVDLSDNVFARTTRRLAGLTDAELLWEPAPNCWSVRERVDGSVRVDWAPYIGGGEVTDSGFVRTTSTGGDALRPPPFTNLAWRIWHLTEVYGRSQNERALTGRAGEEVVGTPRRTAVAAMADLTAAHGRWRAVLMSLTVEHLGELLAGGRHAAATKVGCVMNMIDEFTHHGAELGVLRDLYAQVHRPDALDADPANLAELAWAGMWHLMAPLVERAANPDSESRGVRALHLAAAAGERDIVERLLQRGADVHATCPLPVVWGGAPSSRWPGETPLQWAAHFGRADIVELLHAHLG
ncbi:MAG: ankyrin repeat domain-containing protein [Acidimicrobiales bacterium]